MSLIFVLLRHGEAESGHYGLSDFERKLTKSGRQQIAGVSDFLKQSGVSDLWAYVSSAQRTRETFSLLDPQLVAHCDYKESIYKCDVEELRELMLDTAESVESAVIIGHNPTIAWFAEVLTQQPVQFLPSGCLVLKSTKSSWAEALYDRWSVKEANAVVGV